MLEEPYKIAEPHTVGGVTFKRVIPKNNCTVALAEVTNVVLPEDEPSFYNYLTKIQNHLEVTVFFVRTEVCIACEQVSDKNAWVRMGNVGIKGIPMHCHKGVVIDTESTTGTVVSSLDHAATATIDTLDTCHLNLPSGTPVDFVSTICKKLSGSNTNKILELGNIRRFSDYNNEVNLPVSVQRLLTQRGQIVTALHTALHKVMIAAEQTHGRDGRSSQDDPRDIENASCIDLPIKIKN